MKQINKILIGGALALILSVGGWLKVGATVDYADKNVIKAGEIERLEKPIKGDFYCFAQKCSVKQPIKGDVIAAAQTIEINAEVDGNVRIAGQDIEFGPKAKISRNVIVFTANLLIDEQAILGQDLTVFGADLDLNLNLERDLVAQAANVKIFGQIKGKTEVQSDRIYVDQKAEILGDAELTAREFDLDQKSFKADFKKHEIKTEETEQTSQSFYNKAMFIKTIYSIISAVITILVIHLLFRKSRKSIVKTDLIISFVIGLGAAVLMPILSLLIILLTPRLGGVIFSLWLVIFLLAPIMALYIITTRIVSKKVKIPFVLALILAVIIYNLCAFVPVFGELIGLFCFGVGFGYLIKKLAVVKNWA